MSMQFSYVKKEQALKKCTLKEATNEVTSVSQVWISQ